ncbi:hypothetical protein KKB40_06035 [Patescibacteria group bacterium]|nr:hypothetical protein [Patescibacteria group bacterium]
MKPIKIKKAKGVASDNVFIGPNPEDLLDKYLQVLGTSEKKFWKKLDILQLKKIFLLSLKDFFEDKITIDQLSAVSGEMFYSAGTWTHFEVSDLDDPLGVVLDWASELSYYNWQKKDSFVESHKKTLREYYEENKHFLDDVKK